MPLVVGALQPPHAVEAVESGAPALSRSGRLLRLDYGGRALGRRLDQLLGTSRLEGECARHDVVPMRHLAAGRLQALHECARHAGRYRKPAHLAGFGRLGGMCAAAQTD